VPQDNLLTIQVSQECLHKDPIFLPQERQNNLNPEKNPKNEDMNNLFLLQDQKEKMKQMYFHLNQMMVQEEDLRLLTLDSDLIECSQKLQC
jgi:hypothetical protein